MQGLELDGQKLTLALVAAVARREPAKSHFQKARERMQASCEVIERSSRKAALSVG
jgi:hypothetical protein